MNIKALTVYFELCLVDPTLHHAYIEAEYGKEDRFWSALERLAIDLPYIKFTTDA